MKFFVILTVLLGICYFRKINLEGNLPEAILPYFEKIACFWLSVWILLWIPELIHVFFKSTVSTKNRAVLITGCDSGFGHEMAKRMDKKGFKVYACCLDPLGYGARRLKEECSDSLDVLYLDVTDDLSIQAAKDFVENNVQESELWAVVNNAGVLKGFHIELCSMKDFEVSMQVNAFGPVRVTRAFLPLLKKSKGRVVNVCSVAGRLPCPYLCAYTMSKYAVVAFTEVLRMELIEFGIRVVSIEPEFFRTEMASKECLSKCLENSLESIDDEIKAQYGERYIEQAKNIFMTTFTSASPKINLVLEAMDKGVCLKYPAEIYKPRRNSFSSFIFYFAERMPRIYINAVLSIVFKCFGIPNPKSGVTFYESLMTI